MDYGRLLRDAWVITWRHRFLWVIGLFAGSGAGACSGPGLNFNFPGQWGTGRGDSGGRAVGPDFQPVAGWIGENLGLFIALVLAAVAVIFLVWLLFWVISLTAQGGMVRATADIASGHPSSLGPAIQSGLGYFWRFLGLWLLVLAVTIAVALFIGVFVAAAIIFISILDESVRLFPIVLAVLFGLALAAVLIPASILLNIVVAFAQQAMVVEDEGPIAALKTGAGLLRSRLGTGLLVWLIGVVVGIAIGLMVAIAMLATIAPLAIVGFFIYLAIGFGGPLVVFIVLAVLVVIAVLWGLSAIVNTYVWSYWTVAYLRLTGREATV